MDCVIPLQQNNSAWANNELRYCLRSLEKNFKDLGDIYLVGHKPYWVKNVKHIAMNDPYPEQNRGANIINKILFNCQNPKLSVDFLFVADDNIMLKPMTHRQIKPYCVYDMKNVSVLHGNKFWIKCLKNTRKVLLKEKLSCYNYEPHTPMIINKDIFSHVMSKYDWQNIKYPTFSLYFNNVIREPKELPDNYRAWFGKENVNVKIIRGKKFLCYSDLGLSAKLQMKIKELFPCKSRYEK